MGRRIRRAGVGPAVGVPASARERRIAYGMASRLIGALHFQTVCAELVEAPFFLFDARKEERPFDKLSTNGSYLSGNTHSAAIAAICARSAERRVGNECVSMCSTRGAPDP